MDDYRRLARNRNWGGSKDRKHEARGKKSTFRAKGKRTKREPDLHPAEIAIIGCQCDDCGPPPVCQTCRLPWCDCAD